MNTEPEKNQDVLGKHLREWRVNAPLPARFQEQVWRRIEHEEPATQAGAWLMFQQLVESMFVHRRLALSYLTVALVVGSAAGYWHGKEQAAGQESSLGQQYIQSVDPYQKHGHL
jgi:hypothetical protein